MRTGAFTALATVLFGASAGAAINYPDFTSATGLTLNGSTTIAGPVLRLTPTEFFVVGTAFVTAPVALGADGSFSTSFSFRVHSNSGTSDVDGVGGSGVAFLMQRDGPTALADTLPTGYGAYGNEFPIFDLREELHGQYDLKVIHPDGAEAIAPYRYLIERSLEPEVRVSLGGPRMIAPGSAGLYGFTLENLTNLDLPYVFFQFGLPELGGNPYLMNLPYVVISTNLGGVPNIEDVPWADLDSRLNTTGEVLAPGYAMI